MRLIPNLLNIKNRYFLYLFTLLQIYFASNTLSFGFWKSFDYVFEYMLLFYGSWLIFLLVLLKLALTICRRFNSSSSIVFVIIFFSLPFAWELWLRSLEIESLLLRNIIRILLLPVIYFYFRVGIANIRWMSSIVAVLSLISFASHSFLSLSFERPEQHNFDAIQLTKRPNIHVIMFDSLTHSRLTQEFMGINNPATDYLESLNNAIHSEGMGFSENIPTFAAWSTLFNFAMDDGRRNLVLSGVSPSRLAILLKENDYTISTGFSSDFFGWKKGKWVDNYYRGQSQSLKCLGADLACITKRGRLEICQEFSRNLFSNIFDSKCITSNQFVKSWPDEVIEHIDNIEQNSNNPQFSAFHIYLPGHTPGDFITNDEEKLEDFKNFLTEHLKQAKIVIEKINDLRKRHSQSIFIIAGDHGLFLSKTALKEERRFIILDNHAVAVSILNSSNLCEWSKNWLNKQRYLTPSRMLVAALACSGESRDLTAHFSDNEDFIRFGESLIKQGNPVIL